MQQQSLNGMDNDPGSMNSERYVPQPLQAGILLESPTPKYSPPPYNECVQTQFTPYSYYGEDTYHSTENYNMEMNGQQATERKIGPLKARIFTGQFTSAMIAFWFGIIFSTSFIIGLAVLLYYAFTQKSLVYDMNS